jgi:hypothetical protein
VVHEGCKEGINNCRTVGAKVGFIVTTALSGEVIYAGAGKTKPAWLLKPSAGTKFAEFTCGGLSVEVTGPGVIGAFPEVNKLQIEFALLFEQALGVQKLQQIARAGAKLHLSAFGFVESGLQSTEMVKFPVAEELKA